MQERRDESSRSCGGASIGKITFDRSSAMTGPLQAHLDGEASHDMKR